MRHDSSTWAFTEDRQAAVDREQNALKQLENADPEFARRITAKLIPDPEEKSVTVRWRP